MPTKGLFSAQYSFNLTSRITQLFVWLVSLNPQVVASYIRTLDAAVVTVMKEEK